MGKHRKALGHHNAGGTVNLVDTNALHPAFKHALIAKPVDERDGRQQRGCQQRYQRDAAKQRLAGHARARERIGKAKGQWHSDERYCAGNPHAVPQAFQQRRSFGVADEVVEPDKTAVFALQGLLQNGEQRQRQKCY